MSILTMATMDAAVALLVNLWAVPGEEAALVDYEDAVLALLAEHGASVVVRVRHTGPPTGPFETQVLRFPSDAALKRFLEDPRRLDLGDARDRAIARTETSRVEVLH